MIIIESIPYKCIYLFLLSLNLYLTVLSGSQSSFASNQERQEWQIDYCTDEEFRCGSGQCIAKPFVCDGIRDCEDGTDETYHQCHNVSCGNQYFQCNYGACINKEYRCDGSKQCVDGSDESTQECNKITDKPKRSRRATTPSDSCAIPPLSLDRMITFSCQPNCDTRNGYVPKMTVATVECKPTYYSENEAITPSLCHNQNWVPALESCYKRCDKLNPVNINLKCYRNGRPIACDENSLIAGSKVRPACAPMHRYSDIPPDYIEITCKENGKWDKSLFSCVPQCGRSYINRPFVSSTIEQRISGGVEEHYGDSPWHVAIYNEIKVLICGGTIINPYIVLSAAHCFDVNNTVDSNSANYEVVVSKVSRNYTIKDNANQQVYKIREIRPSNKGYHGLNNYFTADIVALILEEKIAISAAVLPACVDWIGLSSKINPAEGSPAKVSGWGLNEHGAYSEMLMTTNLSFISRDRCFNTVPSDFRPYVTFDKFCAGAEEGPSVLQGDSGGGLLFSLQFQKESFYYLRGIVSLKQPTITAISAFTDIADHIDWISTVRNEVESRMVSSSKKTPLGIAGERICNNYNVSNCVKVQDCSIVDVLIVTKMAIYCGYDTNGDDAEKICCKFPDIPKAPPTTTLPPPIITLPPTTSLPPTTAPTLRTEPPIERRIFKTSAEIASSYCEEYSKYATDCVSDVPPTGRRSTALSKEYPHIAYIGCESDTVRTYWTCVGSLISEQFVLSVVYCEINGKGIAKWVHLGALIRSTVKSEMYDRMYDVERSYIHPDYSFPRSSIALYKLKTPVVFNSFIRPICLYTLNFNQISSRLRMASWGTSVVVGGQSKVLQKGTLTVVDDQECSNVNNYDRNSMACVGDRADREALCLMSPGSPLQMLTRNTSCTWTLYAMHLAHVTLPNSCENPGNADPQLFTKVSYYLDWIQGIVWPSSPSQNTQLLYRSPVRIPQNEPDEPNESTNTRTSAEIVSSYCEKYSKYATDCVNDAPSSRRRKHALLKEYPHIALIGCESDTRRTYWTCVGSLISESFVLSVAYCETGGKGAAKWAHLGALIKSTVKSEVQDRMYDIERSYIHPDYSFPRGSIALYKLKTPVVFNSYIRPACLYSSNFDQINSKLRTTSWGANTIAGAESDDLLKGTITVVDDQRCSNIRGYDPNSMACAGDVTDGEALCVISTGSPLQILTRNTSCMWTIYAMHFAHLTLPDSCENVGNAKPQLYTKISYYLEWIQGIVWP